MSHRGFFATLAAYDKRVQRDSARRYRERLVQQKHIAHLTAQAQAAHEVQLHDDYLEFIVSLHRDASSALDWHYIANTPPPAPVHTRQQAAAAALASFRPGITDRLLGHANTTRQSLEYAQGQAAAEDHAESTHLHAQWVWYQQIAQAILHSDVRAYAAVVENLCPFEELETSGMAVQFRTPQPWYAECLVTVPSNTIPTVEKKLLASGKVASKEMSKAKYWAHYQDYVCSAALRAGREMFALLPISKAYVHIAVFMLDTSTGHDRPCTIVSVEFDRGAFHKLNFDRIDASDALVGFRHAMSFKKTTGFVPVVPLEPLASLTSA